MSKEMFLTCSEAVRLFKHAAQECKFAVPIKHDVYFPGDVVKIVQGAAQRYLTISRQQALRLVRGMIGEDMEKDGGRIKVTELEWNNTKTVYWIG